jgi:hypothetical protein
MISTNNDFYKNAALKVFAQLGQLIEEDEILNNNHILFHELPNDIIHKISNNLLSKNDKRFNKIFNEYKDDKLLKILFGDNIPELKYINPDIYNEYKQYINLDCIKEYIHNTKKFNNLTCHSFQIIYRVNKSIHLTSFNIRILDENNNKIGSINSSCKVSYKYKDKDREEFLCNKECQNIINNINNEIKEYITNYKLDEI